MKVPFVDLVAQYQTIKTEIDQAIQSVISQSAFIGGSFVEKFENEYSQWMNIKHTIGCANGTDSLEIILKAWGIGKDDEVIVPAMTWISTAEAVSNVGATPVFADVHDQTYTILPEEIRKKITKSTRAIMPVHLYGKCADMPAIMAIAKEYGLKVLEDCAQSHGATITGVKAGLWGDAASFSFYPGKNLGAYGDAGCIATNDSLLAGECRMIANHGQKGKHNHVTIGRNSRLDGIHAAVLSVKLKYIDSWNDKRLAAAKYLNERIDIKKYELPSFDTNEKHVFHIYSLRCLNNNRDQVMDTLGANGISTAIHYPVELPSTPAYKLTEVFTNSRKIAQTHLSLPMFAEITTDQLDYIVECLNRI
jgi:dTDP-4-amino-4,6-dideoxygalactose transaminase